MEYELGDEIKVHYSKQPECAGEIKEYYTYGNRGEYIDYTERYTKKNENGNMVCTSVGHTSLCIIFPETEHYKETWISLGKVRIYNNEDPLGGFNLSGYRYGETMKKEVEDTTVTNGTGSFCEWFACEGNAAWLNEHITFKVSDVTPKEYRNLMDWAGWNTSEPEIKVETYNLKGVYGEATSVTTSTTSGKIEFSGKAMSQCKLTVTAGVGVRVCRLDAYRNGVLYDTMYVAPKPYDEDGNPIEESDETVDTDTYDENYDENYDDVTYDENGDDGYSAEASDDVEYDEYGNVIDSENTVSVDDYESQQSSDSDSSSSSSYSGSGSSVVDYATQFVGNPYVWGGTSLTNGADCSGFVQSVYANFGVSLPRTSYEQQNAGTEVSYADAQPGDLICYGGHVAIYMGNGQIVHASNSVDGIKISDNAAYRTIVSVRRLV